MFVKLMSLLNGSSGRNETSDTTTDRLNNANHLVGEICRLSGVPGASIGVIHMGNDIHSFNYGNSDQEAKVPTTSDTVFGVGSVTKSFIAAGISNLVDQGKLSWDTPVKQILPEFQQANQVVEEMLTISDLLSHRSGLAGFGDMSLAFQGDGDMLLPKSSLLDVVKQFPTLFPFRSDWSYFVWGYALAGEAIERLTGRDLHSYIQETLLQPLGLHATTFDPDSVDPVKLAKPYAGLSNGTGFRLPKLQVFKNTFFEASGGLYSSLNDVTAWCKAMLEAIRSGHHPVIKDVESIVSNHVPIANPSLRERSYGYGWVRTQLPGVVGVIGDNVDLFGGIQDHPVLGSNGQPRLMLYHQGSTVGYYTFVALFPETDSAVIVLINSIALSDAADWIARVMISALFDLQDGQDYIALVKKANDMALGEYDKLAKTVNATRAPCATEVLPKLDFFVGRYKIRHKPFYIDILPHPDSSATKLIFQFQGLQDQTYELRHLCGYQFEWALTHDESKKRGRYNNAVFGSYVFEFEMNDNCNEVVSFSWASDPMLPERREIFYPDKERHGSPELGEAQAVLPRRRQEPGAVRQMRASALNCV
ncbi:hypothetical protein ACJ41O_012046 [Fusarium nematophilum]